MHPFNYCPCLLTREFLRIEPLDGPAGSMCSSSSTSLPWLRPLPVPGTAAQDKSTKLPFNRAKSPLLKLGNCPDRCWVLHAVFHGSALGLFSPAKAGLPAASARCARPLVPQCRDLLRVALCRPPSGHRSLTEVKELGSEIGGVTAGPVCPAATGGSRR